jgi:hypothetical protein
MAVPKTQPDTTLQIIDGDHTRGDSDAPGTILVYGDYAIGVNGTPSVFINGERYLGARDVASLREALARR